MTVPEERTRAVTRTREFLRDLANPQVTPRVPKRLRERALSLLKHYPYDLHLVRAAQRCPEWWGLPGEHLVVRPLGAEMLKHERAPLMNVAEGIRRMTSEELEQLIRESAPMAAQLREVFEFLATPDVQQLIGKR